MQPLGQNPPLAPLADRFLAFMVDAGLFVTGYNASFFCLFYRLGIGTPQFPSPFAQRIMVAFWASLFFYYQAYFLSRSGQTVGKKIFGLKVIDSEGNIPQFGAAFARALGYIASSTFLDLGFLWAIWDKSRRTWHDLLAGTRVVEIRTPGLPERQIRLTAGILIAIFLVAEQWGAEIMKNSVFIAKFIK
jgi:uncharacterized RDD family membrane protein YckC